MPKFDDIKKFTEANYRVDVSLRHLKNHLQEWANQGLQLNPDFQRGHVWTEEQQIKYVEFLLRGGKSARDVYFNHPHWHTGYDGDFVCVDGLQRITACIRFLNDEIKVFGYLCSEFEDQIELNNVRITFNVNNLKTRAEVLQWYLEMNSGGTIHTQEELDRVTKILQHEIAK